MAVMRVADQEDAGAVGRVFADGFGEDPVMRWVFEEPNRDRKLRAFFGFLAEEAFVPLGATYVLPGSCAAWTPPDTPSWPAERGERFAALLERTCTAADIERLGILDAATQEHHPEGELWYLSVIATVGEARGRGFGSALLWESLQRVDAARLPGYLESTNPRNVALYERHGFQVTGEIDLPDGPALTTMWREPAER